MFVVRNDKRVVKSLGRKVVSAVGGSSFGRVSVKVFEYRPERVPFLDVNTILRLRIGKCTPFDTTVKIIQEERDREREICTVTNSKTHKTEVRVCGTPKITS